MLTKMRSITSPATMPEMRTLSPRSVHGAADTDSKHDIPSIPCGSHRSELSRAEHAG